MIVKADHDTDAVMNLEFTNGGSTGPLLCKMGTVQMKSGSIYEKQTSRRFRPSF